MLAQTFADFELIICDNASTDRTEAICRRFAANDARLRYSRLYKHDRD
jgi:glycosyltransferase involved in cell wall biosynthesis